MTKYVLDTNLYIRAFRSVDGAEDLRSFYATFTPNTFLSSIVLHELLVGATSATKFREILEALAGPFKRSRRILTPSADAWEKAGVAISEMVRDENRELETVPKSLVNDVLLAVSCRESGATLVTENQRDFKRISVYVRLQFTTPWPA